MKYYHIIYNSSERYMEGGVGFGIRTATDGTPEGLLKAIKDATFFTDDWEYYDVKPTPAQLTDDPASIKQVPMNYAITQLADENGHSYFVVARRAYVGFDYGFYKNGMPTRPGNYVIDYYAFDSAPQRSVYEILYEAALPESNHFIPKSVCPTADNEEMITISVGSQPPLAVEDKPFGANLADSLTKDAVKLFFYYLQAKSANQKLLVKVSRQNANKLLADFYRMLPVDLSAEIRTYVNLRSQGTNDNFDIYFIHEDYPHQIYPGLYNYVEIESAEMPDTLEAKTFAGNIANFVSDSYEENKEDVDDLLKWVTLPEHDIVKSMSKETNDAFFSYCVQPSNFFYTSMKNSKGELNRELLPVLCTYTGKSAENAARFNELVTEAMNEITAETAVALIKEYNEFEKIGFSLKEITLKVKAKVCSVILSDINLFKQLLDDVKQENISKFFIKEMLEEKNAFLDTPLLDKYMTKLYTLFFTEEELKNKVLCIWRFMKRDIDQEILITLVDDIYQDNATKIKFFVKVLKEEHKPFNVVWEYLKYYLAKGDGIDFIVEFENKHEDAAYAPMFYYTLKKRNVDSFDKVVEISTLLSKNSALKKTFEENFSSDNIYDAYYRLVDAKCDKEPLMCLEHINTNIFKFLNVKDYKWNIIKKYIELVIAENNGEKLDKNMLQGVYDKVVEHKNDKLFNIHLNSFMQLVKDNSIGIQAFVIAYKRMNPQKNCIETLTVLDSGKNNQEMAGAVIVKNFGLAFAEAMQAVEEFGYSSQFEERFLTEFYEKEYKQYRIKNRIKNFFKSIASIFKSKGKKEKKEKEKNTKKETKKEK